MDKSQAELWAKVVAEHPDRAVIAADWFEEQSCDVADRVWRLIREMVRLGEGELVGRAIDRILNPLPEPVERQIRSTLKRNPTTILSESAGSGIASYEPFRRVIRPSRVNEPHHWVAVHFTAPADGKYRWTDDDELYSSRLSRGFDQVELIPYRIAARHEYPFESFHWRYTVWAGRATDGTLLITENPRPEVVEVRREEPKFHLPGRDFDLMSPVIPNAAFMGGVV